MYYDVIIDMLDNKSKGAIMYIEKYWGNYIGGTDDSLTLLDYLIAKDQEEFELSAIFSALGPDELDRNFRTSGEHEFTDAEGLEYAFSYAIDLVTDIAALVLECSVNGSISLEELSGDDEGNVIKILLSDDEKSALNDALLDFIENPLEYDLHEMMDDEEMKEMAEEVEALRADLFD